ncbi:MAG: helix-turn-helix domain-containing protein [Bacteroidales bacterium]|nr:helix-turn-helix domain-containing protein [Bacteroidales bacterium]
MNRLKKLRSRSNIALRELSRYVDIAYPALSLLENNKQPFKEVHILKLKDFFDVTADYLLGYSIRGIGINFESAADDEYHVFISEDEYFQIQSKHDIEETIIRRNGDSEFEITIPGQIIKDYSGRYLIFRSVRIAKENAGINQTVRNEITKEMDRMDIYELEKLLRFIKDYLK